MKSKRCHVTGFTIWAGLILLSVFTRPAMAIEPHPLWGRLANPGFDEQRICTTLFFAGQAKDGTNPYGADPAPPDIRLLNTVHPLDERHLKWFDDVANRDFALGQMIEAGINVVTMSSWGEDFLPYTGSWEWAPMQTSPQSHDELYAAAVGKPLLIMPFIESRAAWNFRNEFPTWIDGKVAPGTVSQVVNLVERHLQNSVHPEWAEKWARVYDCNGEPRYAVVLIHAASNRLTADEHAAYAAGFDLMAGEVLIRTGVNVGFFIDALPPNFADATFKPTPDGTATFLKTTPAFLGIQCFISEIWPWVPDDAARMAWKRDFSQRWWATGIPFLMDISPGYDAHIVFPSDPAFTYGYTPAWRDGLGQMVSDFGRNGTVYNSWNGYTEGMAAVPTNEHGDTFFQWLKGLTPKVGDVTAPAGAVPVNTSVNASASFADPCVLLTHTAVWDWGDGCVSDGTVEEANGAGSVSGEHVYVASGIYTVRLTIRDGIGVLGESVFQYVVVYDPSAGFVTGGGWIQSPAGAYAPDPALTGKANFGFVSKYQKGATVPTGQTQFNFQVADLSFHSASYDWLVVAGAHAKYKGTGTINGSGNYGFMLTTTDGQISGGGGVDTFRIKIWDKAADAVVYDNQMGAADDAEATDAIEGGSIVIHLGK